MVKQKIEFIIPESDIESNKLDLNYDGDPLLDATKNESDDFNFKEFLTSSVIAYNVIYDMPINRDSIADFIKNLLADTVLIDDYRSILIASFILTPIAIVSTTPILFAYGESGSGKSGIGSIAASLYGVKVFGVLTYAGMRNLIHQKFTNGKREKNFMFVIDDIHAKFLSDPNIFSMLKSGCYRLYERIAIAGKEPGEIIEFFCFCPKLFSSQWNLFNDERFIELNRRFIPIPTFKSSKVPKNELAAINFTGIEKHFSNIWKDREICIEYAQRLAIYNASLPKIADENQIATDQLTILLPQAVTAELFKMCSIKEYFEYIKKSWQLTKNNVASRELDQCCQKIIDKISRNVVIDDIEYIKIRHQQFVDAVTYARKKEITDLKMPEIKKVLLNQGWTFTVDLLDENQCLWLKKIG